MSDNNSYDDLHDNDDAQNDEGEGMKSLRDAYKKAQKELADLKSEKRQSEVAQSLRAAGLPAEAAKFAKDADDLDKWIEENRGLFNTGAGASETPPAEEAAPSGGAPSLTPEQIEQMKATQIDTPSQFQKGSHEEILSKLDSAGSEKEYYQILETLGMRKPAGSF